MMEHMHSLSLLARNFPRILVLMDNNEIGRYDEVIVGQLAGTSEANLKSGWLKKQFHCYIV